jgi:sigma-E factor negative regulatory protein RseA
MTDEMKEKISVLLDGQLTGEEGESAIDHLKESEALRRSWDRYHLIGDVMRGEGVRISAGGVAGEVSRRLQEEPAIVAIPQRRDSKTGIASQRIGWMRPAAGAAIAASVAAAVVFTFPQVGDFSDGQPVQVASAPAPVSYKERNGTRWKNLAGSKVESKLNRYLVDHSEFASQGGITGVHPYTSFVSYDSSR